MTSSSSSKTSGDRKRVELARVFLQPRRGMFTEIACQHGARGSAYTSQQDNERTGSTPDHRSSCTIDRWQPQPLYPLLTWTEVAKLLDTVARKRNLLSSVALSRENETIHHAIGDWLTLTVSQSLLVSLSHHLTSHSLAFTLFFFRLHKSSFFFVCLFRCSFSLCVFL
jgi:hypothetical protein